MGNFKISKNALGQFIPNLPPKDVITSTNGPMLPNNSLSFITNNVNGLQLSKKGLKLMQYFKDKIGSTSVLFLQETHSDSKFDQNGKGTLKVQFFSNSNSCGVLTAYFGTGTFIAKKQQTDKESGILILDVVIDDSEYILINLYNANSEKEQIDVLSILFELLEEFDTNPKKQLVMAGGFNLFFESKLEAQGGNPTLQKKSLTKLIEFKETYDLRDIWMVRNTKSKRFTFTQKHSSGFIQTPLLCLIV